METLNRDDASEALAAELYAALNAKRSALDFESRVSPVGSYGRLRRDQAQVLADQEAVVKAQDRWEVLADLAGPLADEMDSAGQALSTLLGFDRDPGQASILRLLNPLVMMASLADERTRAVMGAARRQRKLAGFEDAVELAAENESLLLALRRFEERLKQGGDWHPLELDWLRLRGESVPGRMRLRAFALRKLALIALDRPLPEDWARRIEAFQGQHLASGESLAWHAAGFSPQETALWRDFEIVSPALAQAWRCHGFLASSAADWSRCGLLPDESGIFFHFGVKDPEDAFAMVRGLGDVDNLLPWLQAGYSAGSIKGLLDDGFKSPSEAAAEGRVPEGPQEPGRRDSGPQAPAVAAVPASAVGGSAVPARGSMPPPVQALSAPNQAKAAIGDPSVSAAGVSASVSIAAPSVGAGLSYTVFVAAEVETLWQALISVDASRQCWNGFSLVSTWKPGAVLVLRAADGSPKLRGTVVEHVACRSLVYSLEALPSEGGTGLSPVQLAFQASPYGDGVQLVFSLYGAVSGSVLDGSNGPGGAGIEWQAIVSNLKSLAEGGRTIKIKDGN